MAKINRVVLQSSLSLMLALIALLVLTLALNQPSAAASLQAPAVPFQLTAPDTPLGTLPQVITSVQFPLGVGMLPTALAVNEATDYVYVAGSGSTAVVSGTQIIASLPGGSTPVAAEGNPTTGYVYVVDRDAGVTVLSGTQVITTVTGGVPVSTQLNKPSGGGVLYSGLGVNPTTGYVYVSRYGYGDVIVLSATQVITSIQTGYGAQTIDVNPDTGYIYALNAYYNTATILSGTQVITTVAVGPTPTSISINRATGLAYVGNVTGNSVTVISATQVITTLQVGAEPRAIVANSQTGYVYVANSFSDDVTIISGTQVITTVSAGNGPSAVEVNDLTGYAYVANYQDGSVTIISATQIVTTTPVGPTPQAIGINPITGYIYVANYNSDEITILQETQVITRLPAAIRPYAVGVNPVTHYAYVADYGRNAVLVVSDTQVITTLPVGWRPAAVYVSPANGFVYVPDSSGNYLAVISGTEVITTLTVGTGRWGAGPIGVDTARGSVYVGHVYDDQLIVISGSHIITQFAALSWPNAIAVDAGTGYVYETSYLTHLAQGHGDVAVISDTQVLAYPPIDFLPVALGVNSMTGEAYVVADGGRKVAILHGTQVIATVSLTPNRTGQRPTGGGVPIYPSSIGIDERSGYVYVTNYLSGAVKVLSNMQVITTLLPNQATSIMGTSPASGYVYATLSNGTVAVLAQARYLGILPLPARSRALAFDPHRHLVYVANYDKQAVTLLQEPIVPRALTPRMIATAATALEIDFEEPALAAAVQFALNPTVAFTVTWDPAQQQASVQHAPFQPGIKYQLAVLPGGMSAASIPIADAIFEFVYYPYHAFLPVIQKGP
jgi:YVTN family beta-propeller protein